MRSAGRRLTRHVLRAARRTATNLRRKSGSQRSSAGSSRAPLHRRARATRSTSDSAPSILALGSLIGTALPTRWFIAFRACTSTTTPRRRTTAQSSSPPRERLCNEQSLLSRDSHTARLAADPKGKLQTGSVSIGYRLRPTGCVSAATDRRDRPCTARPLRAASALEGQAVEPATGRSLLGRGA